MLVNTDKVIENCGQIDLYIASLSKDGEEEKKTWKPVTDSIRNKKKGKNEKLRIPKH